MKIRKLIESKLNNARLDLENGHYSNKDRLIGNIEAYQDLLALIPKPRTEQEVLNEKYLEALYGVIKFIEGEKGCAGIFFQYEGKTYESIETLKELVEKFEEKNEVEITCILLGRGKHFIMSLGKNKFLELPDKLYSEFTLIESINNVEIYHTNSNSTNMRNRLNIVLRGLDND